MGSSADCTTLVRIMIEEIRLLEQYFGEIEKVKESIISRMWPQLQETIQSVSPLSVALSLIEKERDRCFRKLCVAEGFPEDERFYTVLLHLPEENRKELSTVFQRLKVTVLKVQGAVKGLDSLIITLSGTIRSVMEELFPYKKGKIYSASGTAKDIEANPMVINRHL